MQITVIFPQDFEDWDDVGLNIPKPPDLLHLYRDYGQHGGKVAMETEDFQSMVDMGSEEGDNRLQDLEIVRIELVLNMARLEMLQLLNQK